MITIQTYTSLPEELAETASRMRHNAQDTSRLAKSEIERDTFEDRFFIRHNPIYQLIARENSEIVGGIKLFKKPIFFRKEALLLGGIGGVWVRSDMRRKGIATILVSEGMDLLKKEKCDIAYLCTTINVHGPLYAKVGFVPLKKQHTYTGKSGKRYSDTDGMIAPVCSPKMVGKIINSMESFDIGEGNW